MKLQIALSSGSQWVIPHEADLRLEYRYEYNLPQRNWKQRCKTIGAQYPLFEDEEDFIAKVKASRIVSLFHDDVHNMTSLKSIEDIESLVSHYAYPRDVKRIVEGLKAGIEMPAPIIIAGSKGMWILSGNTRQNCAKVLGIPRKFIVVNAS
jgi:hypothetical protein